MFVCLKIQKSNQNLRWNIHHYVSIYCVLICFAYETSTSPHSMLPTKDWRCHEAFFRQQTKIDEGEREKIVYCRNFMPRAHSKRSVSTKYHKVCFLRISMSPNANIISFWNSHYMYSITFYRPLTQKTGAVIAVPTGFFIVKSPLTQHGMKQEFLVAVAETIINLTS